MLSHLQVLALDPPEFASELLLPFTLPFLRRAPEPWLEALRVAPAKFAPALRGSSGSGHARL